MRSSIMALALFAAACSGSAGGPKPDDAASDAPFNFDLTTDADLSITLADRSVDAPLPACARWTEWSCQEEVELLCTATCGTKLISCTNGGVCQCGAVATGPCEGVYTGSSPCEVCQNALAGGCCAPELPDGGN